MRDESCSWRHAVADVVEPCLAALLVLPAWAAEPLPMGTLSGRVVNPDGQPVADARIWADIRDTKTSSTTRLAEARTDAEGRSASGRSSRSIVSGFLTLFASSPTVSPARHNVWDATGLFQLADKHSPLHTSNSSGSRWAVAGAGDRSWVTISS